MKNLCRLVTSGPIGQSLVGATVLSNLVAVTLLLTLPLFAQAQAVAPDTYTVCPAGQTPCDYTTPEAAVNDPARVDGDEIDITTGTYVLVSTLEVNNSITILANNSVFDADRRRAIDVTGANTNLSLTNVTIRNGLADASGGGALRVSEGAIVTVINGVFEDNEANFGGAVHNDSSTVTLRESVFSGNRATAGNGGAVLTDSGGETNVQNTTVDGNLASNAGGGLAVAGNGSRINFIASTISNNAALDPIQTVSNETLGGSSSNCGVFPSTGEINPGPLGQTFIADAAALTAYEITITMFGNGTDGIPNDVDIPGQVRQGGPFGPIIATASAFAPGGVWASNTNQVLTFTLDRPIALVPGETYGLEFFIAGSYGVINSPDNTFPDGGLYAGCGGANLAASTVSDFVFKTYGGSPGEGGGVFASASGSAGLYNSTLSGNIGDGAVATDGAIVSTLFSTVTNNSGNGLTAVPDQPDVAPQGLVFFTTSIIAGNGGNDCDGDVFNLTSSGFNLIGDDSNCPFSPQPGDLVGTNLAPIDPLLGPLQFNGGRTFTHAIDDNSPAYDAGGTSQDTYCSDAPTGQRGTVRPNGSACDIGSFEYAPPLSLLQTLINEATQGSTINVPDGIYTESITIGDGKTLSGSGPDNVVIDASNLGGPAITATGDFALIGIRVTGGAADNGGGIFADIAGTNISLDNVVFNDNAAVFDGGAIYLRDGTLTGSDTAFGSNAAGGNGGAIFSGTSATISGSQFQDNSAGQNGGAIAGNGTLTSSNNTFDTNLADNGGAISIGGGTLASASSSDDFFGGNMATRDGGAIHESVSNLVVLRGAFGNNTAGDDGLAGDGGAIYSDNSLAISESIFTGNGAVVGDGVPGEGGAIFYNGSLSVVDSYFLSNGAGVGGGLYGTNNGLATISGTLFEANVAEGSSSAGTAGGAIGGSGTLQITNSTLSGNTSSGNGNGAGIGLLEGSARLNNVTLAGNAGPGGPIYAESGEPGAFIAFSNTLIANSPNDGTNCSTVSSLGYNLFQNLPCLNLILASDIVSDPSIFLLQDNGGPTDTIALQPQSPAINAGAPELNFETFDATTIGDWQLRGFASTDSGSLLMASGNSTVGSAFLNDPVDVTVDFSARFQFRMTPAAGGSAADGITFSIVADPTLLGDTGNALGIAEYPAFGAEIGIVEGVSVEFDTWTDDGGADGNLDHVGIDLDGNTAASPFEAFVGPNGTFSNGSDWTAWVDYNASSDLLEVRVSETATRPIAATISTTVNIADFAGASAFIGFTGSTGFEPISGEHRILNFSFSNATLCEATDQRGEIRPQGGACDIGAFEAAPVPLTLGQVSLSAVSDLESNESYPGVTDIPIINIPIEKLTGDVNNAPESAPLGSFPLGSFPIGSFDLRSAPIGSFPLGSFPIGSFPIGSFPLGSFPIGSFPLSSIPLLREGGWSRILEDIPELEGAPLQTVTLEQVLTSSSVPASVDEIELRDLAIEGSPLASLSLQGLSLGATTVEEIDQWASTAGSTNDVCSELATNEPAFTDCAADDTLLSLEFKGAPVSALSLQSLPLGSFPTTATPLGSFPIGSFPLGSFPLGSFPLGSFPLGSFPLGSFPLGSFPIGSFPIGSFPLGSFELDGKSFCELYDEKAAASAASTCSVLGIDPGTDSLADLVTALQTEAAITNDTTSGLASTPLGSFPLGSFPLGSFPIGSFPLGSFPIGSFPIGSFPIGSFPIGSFPLGSFPIGSFPLGSFNVDGQPFCEVYDRQADFDGVETCAELSIDPATASLEDLINVLAASYGDIASTPLGSFPIGSFPIGSFPIGSFPLGSFDLNAPPLSDLSLGDFGGCELIASSSTDDCGTLGLSDSSTLLQVAAEYGSIEASPLGSFPLGSFGISDLPMGSFPIGSFEINGTPLGSFPLGSFELINSPIGSFPIGSFPIGSFPLGSFPLGSFDFVAFPIGSFPLGSFTVDGQPFCDVYDQKAAVDGAQTCGDLLADPANATLPDLMVALGASGATDIASTPLGSFPLGSFPLGSFPIGSFPADIVTDGPCDPCETLADAARAGVINPDATLADLEKSTAFASVTLAEVMDAMTMATLYGEGDLRDIDDLGSLTLGQLLIAMMLKTDFPWETIPLDKLDPQTFSADNFVEYTVEIPLLGTESKPLSVAVTLAEDFLYVKGSASLDVENASGVIPNAKVADPLIVDNSNGSQTLSFNLVLGGFSNNTLSFKTVPPLALGEYPATAMVTLGTDEPVATDDSNGMLSVIPYLVNDATSPEEAVTTPANVLTLGHISAPDDNDYYLIQPPAAGDRVAVFMSNPSGDNDLIMYEPLTTVEAKGQNAESAPLDSVPFEDDGAAFVGNVSEEPNALEDVNLSGAPLASISTNRGTLDEFVSAIAGETPSGETAPFTIQVSGYNGALPDQSFINPYTLRVKVTPQVPTPQCSARSWPADLVSTIPTAGNWTANTNAVFFINYARLAASDPNGVTGADAAMTAINSLVSAPGIVDGVVVDVSTITGVDNSVLYGDPVDYSAWDNNPCDVDAANSIVNAITRYVEYKRESSPRLTYITIVGSDEVIPFARKPDETSIANESTFAGEFSDNALYGALVTRHFLSDDPYGDIDPIPWLDRYLNVPELAVGRLVESAADIQLAAENYLAFGGVLDPQTALSAGYDFVEDASEDIDNTFREYSPVFGYIVQDALIDQPGIDLAKAWDRAEFLGATGIIPASPGDPSTPVDLVSFNMHFDFDEALPSSGDASGDYSSNLISTADLAGSDLTRGIWFTVGCHSGTNVPDVSVVAAAPGEEAFTEDWAQTFSRLGALYVAQNAFGLGDTEALALTERLMAIFARNLNGNLTIGQAHAFAKQQYFADLGLYGEYDYKAMQAATLFGLPMYKYGYTALEVDPPEPLPVTVDPISGLSSTSWTLTNTGIGQPDDTDKGAVFSANGEVQFVHYRPLQPIVRRDVTSPDGEVAAGAFLTQLATEDIAVEDIAFARPVIDLGENEPEIETDEVVFPTAFTNIANFKAPPPGGGPFEPRDQLNVIVGQFTSPLDGQTNGTERLFRSFDTQVFYRPAVPATAAAATTQSIASEDFRRPEFDNVQASVVGSGAPQASFSVDVSDDSNVLRVAVLYLQSVTGGIGNWALVDLVKGGGNTWTGGGPVDLSGISNDQIDYMVQAVDENGNVANSTFKGLFYVAETLPTAPAPVPDANPGDIGVIITVDGDDVNPGDWITSTPVDVTITDQDPDIAYEYSVDYGPYEPLTTSGFQITGDGVHIVTVRESDGSNPVTFVVLVDTTPPQVVITTPAAGQFVTQGSEPVAEYDCLDAGSGITSCVGSAPDGSPTPSANTGAQSFVVTAQDDAGKGPSMEENVYYVVQPLEVLGPIGPTDINDPVSISISATDLAGFEETVTIDWGDGSPAYIVDMSSSSVSMLSVEHLYTTQDVFQISVEVDYEGQFTQINTLDFIVVSDTSDGFVSGGGWFNSPTGAYTPNESGDEDVIGKAHFGFVSKYKKGQSVPSGSTNFRFATGDLDFKSTSYDWMIITGARVRYKGRGTVNGQPETYKFQVTALDADISGAGVPTDGFRIKIWRDGDDDEENILYDNGHGASDDTGDGGTTPISRGSINIHKPKK